MLKFNRWSSENYENWANILFVPPIDIRNLDRKWIDL